MDDRTRRLTEALATQEAVEWSDWAKTELLQPIIAQAVLVIFNFLVYSTSHRWIHKFHRLRLIKDYVGTSTKAPTYPHFLTLVWLVNAAASIMYCVMWVRTAYIRDAHRRWEDHLVKGMAWIFLVTYALRALIDGFKPSLPWQMYRLIDIFSTIPSFGVSYNPTWVSWRFLRVASSLEAIEELDRSGALASVFQFTEYTKALILLVAQTLALICTLAGTVFVLEVLGEIPYVEDHFYVLDSGDAISPFQCFYWMITTVSTVGYGDFAPTTIPSRLFICMAIVLGVSWFGVATGNLLSLKAEHDKGRDSRKLPTSGHLVIMGGGLRGYNAVLVSLLGQLYGGPAEEQSLKTVLMGSSDKNPVLLNAWMERVPLARRNKVLYFAGSPMVGADLKKVNLRDAQMVIVIANPNAQNSRDEDSENIMRALSVLEAHRETKIRLVLINPEAQTWAVSAGIPEEKCISIQELKVNMLAQCCRCHGYATLISLLLRADMVNIEDLTGEAKWQVDFFKGSNRRIQGVTLPRDLAGLSWANVALKLFKEQRLTMIAAQINGKLVLNPMGTQFVDDSARDWNQSAVDDVVFVVGDKIPDKKEAGLGVRYWPKPFLRERRKNVIRRDHAHYITFFDYDKGAQELTRNKTGSMTSVPSTASNLKHEESGLTVPKTVSQVLRNKAFIDVLHADSRERQKVQKRRYRSVEVSSGHMLVLVPTNGSPYPSEMVASFIHPLRSMNLRWEMRPLIFLSDTEPPEWLEAAYPSVIFLKADPRSATNLKNMSLDEGTLTEIAYLVASAPELRTGSMYPHELMCLEDSACMVVTHMLEVLLSVVGNKSVYTIYELVSARSASLLGRSPDDINNYTEDDSNSKVILSKALGSGGESTIGFNDAEPEDDGMGPVSFYQLPGFAGGHLFTVDFVGQMMAMEATFPAMIELVEGMIMPEYRGQHMASFLVNLPKEAATNGWTYMDLMTAWTEQGATLLGIYRALSGEDMELSPKQPDSGGHGHSAWAKGGAAHENHPRIRLESRRASGAILEERYRSRFAKRFVIACPDGEEKLHKDDLIYVLAHPNWAKEHLDQQDLDDEGNPTWLSYLQAEQDVATVTSPKGIQPP
eukprot:CAMPEP_0178424070 /NCGR_PEP_ID=MMETSP0689_2-20121128/28020_1 /TAXON_ID=160604 /ORGANISM="Amphidinium massartii, Strain CS-259" /LENGTH=1102 /DNA_ID=CAMNT_0020045695 /DNA_START=30 /DNA_END=3334 /DNA_ORIENTATION=+